MQTVHSPVTQLDFDQQVELMFEKADHLMVVEGKFALAKDMFLQILEMDPENIDALNSIASCIKYLTPSNQSHFDECMPFYYRALLADAEDFETNFNLGNLFYHQKKDHERAIHFLKIAINDEKNPAALFNLGVIYEEIGEY